MNKQILKIGVGIVSVLFLLIASLLVVTYIFPVRTPLIQFFQSKLPAAIVAGNIITFGDVEENRIATQNFYENSNLAEQGIRIDFSTDDGRKRLKLIELEVFNKLVEDQVIQKIAEKEGISIEGKDIEMALKRTLQEGGNVEYARQKVALYGWDFEQFADRVIRPTLYHERLEEKFQETNHASEEVQSQIAAAKKMLDDERDFFSVAQQYSQSPSGAEGGYEGFFRYSDLDPEIAKLIFDLDKGTVTDVIESKTGLHIFRIADVIEDGEGNRSMVALSQIFVEKKLFAAYVEEHIRNYDVMIFLPQYVWDEETQFIVFSDPEMIAFENRIIEELIRLDAEAQEAIENDREEAKDGEVMEESAS